MTQFAINTGRLSSSTMLEQRIQQHFIDSADLKYQAAQLLSKPIAAAVQAMLACVTSGGKVLACGNGGSAADAQHFAAEFVGRFERERPELGAIALTTDSSILTAIANDYDFNVIFAKQVRALGLPGDVQPPEDALEVEAQQSAEEPADPDASVVAGTLRAPWRWEKLLVEAAVIGQDAARWKRRLDGKAAELRLQVTEARRQHGIDSAQVHALEQMQEQLVHLQAFALPVIETLAAWPQSSR